MDTNNYRAQAFCAVRAARLISAATTLSLIVTLAPWGQAWSTEEDDFLDLSLDELVNATVSTASKFAQKTIDAPAWRIERDYEELKQELGLGHFEGRNWRGFHHHASLCIAAYGFLMLERLSGNKKNAARFKTAALPEDFRPRGAGPNATPHANVNRDVPLPTGTRHR